MSLEEQERANIAINFLNRYVPTARQFFFSCYEEPKPGSTVARARTNRDLVLTLDATLILEGAIDHYQAIVNEFTCGPVPRYALYTIIRGALEADAWACWLLDPAINESELLARALTQRASNLLEVRRMGITKNYKKQTAAILAIAKRWKLAPRTNRETGDLLGFVPRPKVTHLLQQLLPDVSPSTNNLTLGEHSYAALSARAHATPWGLLHNVTVVEPSAAPVSTVALTVDVMEVIRLLGVAVRLHEEATRRMATLAGLEPALWESRRGPLPW
jgi:hypothetical protein